MFRPRPIYLCQEIFWVFITAIRSKNFWCCRFKFIKKSIALKWKIHFSFFLPLKIYVWHSCKDVKDYVYLRVSILLSPSRVFLCVIYHSVFRPKIHYPDSRISCSNPFPRAPAIRFNLSNLSRVEGGGGRATLTGLFFNHTNQPVLFKQGKIKLASSGTTGSAIPGTMASGKVKHQRWRDQAVPGTASQKSIGLHDQNRTESGRPQMISLSIFTEPFKRSSLHDLMR